MLYDDVKYDLKTKKYYTERIKIKQEEFYNLFRKEDNIKGYDFETSKEIPEWKNRGISENDIRKEHGLPPRRSYSPIKGN